MKQKALLISGIFTLAVAPLVIGAIAYQLKYREVGVGLIVFWILSYGIACHWMGWRNGQAALLTGGKLVMDSQKFNDEWDVKKAQTAMQMIKAVQAVQSPPPVSYPQVTGMDEWTMPELVEFNVRG